MKGDTAMWLTLALLNKPVNSPSPYSATWLMCRRYASTDSTMRSSFRGMRR